MTAPDSQNPSPDVPPTISDAEWVVMRVLWDRGSATANQVVEALASTTEWKPKTIHTLLRRLVQKGAVACDKTGREYQFCPRVAAADCIRVASRSFLDRFFDGRMAPFLACFLETESLSPGEVEELRRILEKMQP